MKELVECTKDYWEFIRNLRNDTRVTSGFIKSQFISKEMQERYMNLNSINYRILLYDKKPVGYVGVIDDDFRICVDPEYQGKGLAKFMLLEAIKIWPSAMAKIKIGNTASIRLFESCGFEKQFYLLSRKTQHQ